MQRGARLSHAQQRLGKCVCVRVCVWEGSQGYMLFPFRGTREGMGSGGGTPREGGRRCPSGTLIAPGSLGSRHSSSPALPRVVKFCAGCFFYISSLRRQKEGGERICWIKSGLFRCVSLWRDVLYTARAAGKGKCKFACLYKNDGASPAFFAVLFFRLEVLLVFSSACFFIVCLSKRLCSTATHEYVLLDRSRLLCHWARFPGKVNVSANQV